MTPWATIIHVNTFKEQNHPSNQSVKVIQFSDLGAKSNDANHPNGGKTTKVTSYKINSTLQAITFKHSMR